MPQIYTKKKTAEENLQLGKQKQKHQEVLASLTNSKYLRPRENGKWCHQGQQVTVVSMMQTFGTSVCSVTLVNGEHERALLEANFDADIKQIIR